MRTSNKPQILHRCLQVPLRFVSGSSNARANAAAVTKRLACLTRLLTRLLQEVWFPAHACQCLVASLFASVFAGKKEVAPKAPRAAVRRDALMTEARAAVFNQPPSVKNSSRPPPSISFN